jgi:hypothetical protein
VIDLARVRGFAAAYWWLVAGGAIGLLTWPYPTIAPTTHLDSSWAIALHLAVDRGLDFGRDIVFTYGPLGFLSQPVLVTPRTGLVAFAFAVVAQFALCAALLRRALLSFPAPVAVLLTYGAAAMLAATSFSNLGDYLTFLMFILAVSALEQAAPPAGWVAPLGAAVAALQLLVKANGGVVCLVLLLLVAWRFWPGGWRAEIVSAATFCAFLVLFWIVSGSSLDALPGWLHQTTHVVLSYTDAMAIEAEKERLYVAAATLMVSAAALIVAHARRLGGARGLAFAASASVYGYAYLKEGFIRFDQIHATLFFAGLAVGLLTISWEGRVRWVAATLVVASVGAVVTTVGSGDFIYRPDQRLANARHEARVLGDGPARDRLIAVSKAAAREDLALDPATIRLLRGHTVDVEPYETSAIWAYNLPWRPQPLIQSYMATDHALDVFNAEALATRGPERILRHHDRAYLNGKHQLFVAPESQLVVVCHYRQLQARGRWEVLGRASNRCGRAAALGSLEARTGQPVSVPSPPNANDLIVARIHAEPTLEQRLASILLKPFRFPEITVGSHHYRLVADVARGPLILRLPKSAGIAPAFGGAVDYRRLSLENVASPFRVEFFAVRLRA